MIVVDSNVVSEFMSAEPAAAVLGWLNEQIADTLYLTAVSVAEIKYGMQLLPEGRRRRFLDESFEVLLEAAFKGRVLSFDEVAARIYGGIMAHRRRIGRPASTLDCQIAAMARSQGFAVATRNIGDFEDFGVELINPFGAT